MFAAPHHLFRGRSALRKLVYAVTFEALGVVVATIGLLVMSDASAGNSLGLAVLANSAFESWEARQPRRGRSFGRRAVHALLFEGGLVLILMPLTAWWLGVGLWLAMVYEAGLIVLFIVYTWAFTWTFDAIFGLPEAARPA